MTSERKQIERTAAYAHRALAAPISLVSRGRKIPASPALGIPKAQVDPVEGERLQATGDRYERHLHLYLKPQASSLKPSPKKDKNRN
jgi:hypothetical protein